MPKLLLLVLALTSIAAHAGTRLGYDPQTDPFDQYHAAIEQARAQNKQVLIIAGGDWCTWCYSLEKFVARNEDVSAAMSDAFVVIKVYVGDENYNDLFFSQLPPARGAPHFWVVSPDRNVLASQSTGAFESGRRSYDKAAFLDFVTRWKGN